MADEIKAGDLVELKSGGPKMTVNWVGVEEQNGPITARCSWFVKDQEKRGSFPVTSLQRVQV